MLEMRRAEYLRGTGRLSVGGGRLLFVSDGEHPAADSLEVAFHSGHPGRALATVVAKAEFDTPAFVFVQVDDKLHGIVYGQIAIRVDDGNAATVDGAVADPWAHFDASSDAVVAIADSGADSKLWLECGVVWAGGFRWSNRSEGVAARPRVGAATGGAEPHNERDLPPVEARASGDVGPPASRPSLEEALSSEFDATIDAIRLAEVRGDKGDPGMVRPKHRGRPIRPVSAPKSVAMKSVPDHASGPLDEPADSDADSDATIDLAPGQVMLDSLHAERRMVEALVCLQCENPNPSAAIRCRHCVALLSSTNTDVREVPQPVLGVIHLSGGREELLDTDLLIGRNPMYLPLDRYQRAVVHAAHDRSVSRRHIELRLDQWRVVAVSLQKGSATIVTSREGRRARLLPGVPRQLRAGDTLHYGSAWLRFESEE